MFRATHLHPATLFRTVRRSLTWLLTGYPLYVYVLMALAVGFLLTAIVVSQFLYVPIRDPEGSLLGKRIIGPFLLMAAFFAFDIVLRARRLPDKHSLRPIQAGMMVFRDRWWPVRIKIALSGFIAFYITYLAYRNLKSFVPFVDLTTHDEWLTRVDLWLTFGYYPADVLQDALGRGFTAHFLSFVYLAFIPLVPFSIGVTLAMSQRMRHGYYYVTAVTINWILGALSYFMIPSIGPFGETPGLFDDLPSTGVTRVQESLLNNRITTINDPLGSDNIQSIAGFASLHVSIVLTALIIAWQLRRRTLTATLIPTFVLTVIATIYFGWHFILDDIAGVIMALMAVTIARWMVFPEGGIRPPSRAWRTVRYRVLHMHRNDRRPSSHSD